MSIAGLKYVSQLMNSLSIPYAFMRWNKKEIPDCYFVGEYDEVPTTTREENGYCETNFKLRGFTRKEWLLLEQAKAKIEANATKTAILDDGTGIAVFYESGMVIPTSDAELKSIQITLRIKEWKVL